MRHRGRWITAGAGLAVLAAGALMALNVSREQWSEWWYGARFELFGETLEGSAVVFLVDRSGSNHVHIRRAAKRIEEMLDSVPAHFEVGVIFVDFGLIRWPPADALLRVGHEDESEFREALAKIRPGSQSCIEAGLLTALAKLENARSENRLLIFVTSSSN